MVITKRMASRGTRCAAFARLTSALAVALLTSTPVSAAPAGLNLDGFGTLGIVHSDEDQADFVSSLLAPEGVGHSGDWSAKVDTKLGLQLSADLAPRTSGVLQFVMEQQHDGTYNPAVEWANLSFDITRDLQLRVGRMVLPTYMTSEYRKVGYATPSSRPPPEVYHLVPVTNSDGLSLSYSARFGQATNTLQVLYGSKDSTVPEEQVDVTVDAENGVTVANTLEWGATSLFASYTNIRLTIDAFNPLFEGYRAFGPPGEAIADRYHIDDERFEIMSIGTRYDPGDWFVMAEWARNRSRTLVGDNRGWYITGGYRLGSLTPYFTLADREVFSETSHPGIDAPQAQPLNALLNEALNDAARQSRVAAGVRWDFARSVALKVQFDHIDLGADSEGVLANDQPGFERGGTMTLFSTTLDFVF